MSEQKKLLVSLTPIPARLESESRKKKVLKEKENVLVNFNCFVCKKGNKKANELIHCHDPYYKNTV